MCSVSHVGGIYDVIPMIRKSTFILISLACMHTLEIKVQSKELKFVCVRPTVKSNLNAKDGSWENAIIIAEDFKPFL